MKLGVRLACVALVAGVTAACGGSGGSSSGEGTNDATGEEELRGRAALLGRWKSEESTYLSKLRFYDDGRFYGEVNVARVGGDCNDVLPSRDLAPCTDMTFGRFRMRAGAKVALAVPKLPELTDGPKTLTLRYELSDNRRKLVLDGPEGQQTFSYYAGCEDVTCDDGLECKEAENWGRATCRRPVPVVRHGDGH